MESRNSKKRLGGLSVPDRRRMVDGIMGLLEVDDLDDLGFGERLSCPYLFRQNAGRT